MYPVLLTPVSQGTIGDSAMAVLGVSIAAPMQLPESGEGKTNNLRTPQPWTEAQTLTQ